MRVQANTGIDEKVRWMICGDAPLASSTREIMFTPPAFGPIHVQLCCAAFAKKKKQKSI
jgi:hypothetical protein